MPLVEVLDGAVVVSDGIVEVEVLFGPVLLGPVLPCPVVVDVPLVDEPEVVVPVPEEVPEEDVVPGVVAVLPGVVAPEFVGSVVPVEPDDWAKDAPMAVASAAAAAAMVKLFGSLVILILL